MVAGNQNLARMGYVKDSAQRWLEVSKSLDIYNSTLSYLCGCVCLGVGTMLQTLVCCALWSYFYPADGSLMDP